MENKGNNGMLIGLLIGLFIAVVVVGCLFAMGTISFKTSGSGNNEQMNNGEEVREMTEEVASNILKEASDKIGTVSNGYSYCGENMKYDEKDVILDEYNISTHTASKDYNSLDNMKDDLEKYMSAELIDKYINASYYIEKDNKLYCSTPHKGTILYDKSKSSYTVESFTNDEIIAKGIVVTFDDHADEYRDNYVIEMKKNGTYWQITKYEIQK